MILDAKNAHGFKIQEGGYGIFFQKFSVGVHELKPNFDGGPPIFGFYYEVS